MWKFISDIAATVVIIGVLAGTGLASYMLPDLDFSEIEGRPLASSPVLHLRSLVDGRYAQELETYMSEQVAGKQSFVTLYMKFNMVTLHKVLMNEVVVGKHGQLLNHLKDPRLTDVELDASIDRIVGDLEALDGFMRQRGGQFLLVTHPSNNSFHRDAYPVGLSYPDTYVRAENKLLEALAARGILHVNMEPALRMSENTQPFLRTDHHWTLQAGHLTYSGIIEKLGMQPLSLTNDYAVQEYGPPIFGSLNRRLGMIFPSDETLSVAHLKVPIPYRKSNNGNPDQEIYRNFEKDASLGKPANYVGYMGGDRDRIIFETDRPELPSVLIFGDSYTNTVEPFLWTHYNETYIIDLRYHNEKSIYQWIEHYNPDHVVFLLKDEFFLGSSGNNSLGRDLPTKQAETAESADDHAVNLQYRKLYQWVSNYLPLLAETLTEQFFLGAIDEETVGGTITSSPKRVEPSAERATGSDPSDVPKPEDGRHYVTKPSAPESVKVDEAFESTGYLGPQHEEGTFPVRIYLFELTESGEYEYQFWTQAEVQNFDTYSKYVGRPKFPRPGSWQIQAVAPADDEHEVHRSGARDVQVTE